MKQILKSPKRLRLSWTVSNNTQKFIVIKQLSDKKKMKRKEILKLFAAGLCQKLGSTIPSKIIGLIHF